VFDVFRGVWKCGQLLSCVFNISSQLKLKLRRKWRNKIGKSEDQISKRCRVRNKFLYKFDELSNEFEKIYLALIIISLYLLNLFTMVRQFVF